MHAEVIESLEDYLSGTLEPAAQRAIEAHLHSCSACRDEVHGMQDVSQMFGTLRSEEAWEANPSFYAAVMQRVETQKPAPTFAGLFGLDFAFGRRLVFSSLLTLAVLGTVLVTHEADCLGGPSPEAVMAQQDAPGFDSAPAPDSMLVTLTAYEH
jgi:anti-sigma factor RsiW